MAEPKQTLEAFVQKREAELKGWKDLVEKKEKELNGWKVLLRTYDWSTLSGDENEVLTSALIDINSYA